ncbi:MAG TPA: EAL domain-containing protein [Vitreimonas sp.]|uniref:putative bifunctional diguanylate cyclase/phosphodiesterase n=1 Tax=Vitreimonas sp. TaxID=3069702 RepID=UPI002D4B7B2F|nr:EAL domain-containing protein [Vitreimonas sp.]HYD88236.1 EAL domain-containing protein [Vitreimonas sp.]
MITGITKADHYKSDLRRLTAMIGAALLMFGVLLLVIVAYAGWSANRTAVVRERQLVENALDRSVSSVLDQQKAIAWWDDAVVNAQARPVATEWLETNVGIYFFETYGHDEIVIVDGQNRPVYANVGGERANPTAAYAARADVLDQIVAEARRGADGHLRPRDRAFAESQSNYDALLGASFGRWAGHIMSVDGEPAVVAAISIVPNLDANLLDGEPHLLLSIVRVDQGFMAQVGSSLLISDLALSAAPNPSGSVLSEAFVADDGAPVGYLTWTPKQPGQTLLMFVLPMVALGVIGAGLLTWLMIGRLKRASSELADREVESRHQALHDALSGLPNRHNFVQRLQEALDGLIQARNNGRVVVAYIDVDRFKDVNDTMGHAAGDALIMAVARRLQTHITPQDFLARFGGDEFAVLRASNNPEAAAELADCLRAAFEESFDVHGQHVRMTASIGLAQAPDHGASPQELMRHADIALYQGKNQGRDRAMMFSSEMAAEVEQRREVELELHAALVSGQLNLHYQPVVSCAHGRVTGLEALLRWKHPTKGDISPAVFVPIAEEAGLMPALGAFVLERAFQEARRWPTLDVAINLSPVQFRHVDLVELLESLLRKYTVDPSRVILEVTEGVMMESTDRNRHILETVRKLGFKIALDDFGTGYSSLRYLCDFRFDKIKIDRAFVTGIHERKRAMTIIQSVVTLGRGLGMDIVAEGVESETEASVMRLVGVTELQGFFFSQAVPADKVDELIASLAEAAEPQRTAEVTDLRTQRGG